MAYSSVSSITLLTSRTTNVILSYHRFLGVVGHGHCLLKGRLGWVALLHTHIVQLLHVHSTPLATVLLPAEYIPVTPRHGGVLRHHLQHPQGHDPVQVLLDLLRSVDWDHSPPVQGARAGVLLHKQLHGRAGPVLLHQELLHPLLVIQCGGERQGRQIWWEVSYRAATLSSPPVKLVGWMQGLSMAVSTLEPWPPATQPKLLLLGTLGTPS